MYQRRRLLGGMIAALVATVGGCLAPQTAAERDDGESIDDHCPVPDDGALPFEKTLVFDNDAWLATDSTPGNLPRLVPITSAERADELIHFGAIDDADRAFIEETDYGESFLLVVDHWLPHGVDLSIRGIERRDADTVSVSLCAIDRRSDDADYPAVEHRHSLVARVRIDDAPTPSVAIGTFADYTGDGPVEIGPYEVDNAGIDIEDGTDNGTDVGDDENGNDDPEPLEPPRSIRLENTDEARHDVELLVIYEGAEIVDVTHTVEGSSTIEIDGVAEYKGEYTIVATVDGVGAERYRWNVYEEVFAAVVVIEADGVWITEDVA